MAAVYRFRITFEENEEVFREIDIKSTQTFHELHVAILASVNFEDNAEASFFISDDVWRRGAEIALNSPDETDKRATKPKYLMKKCKLALLIDDPHQKFIYIQDPDQSYTFLVELAKILTEDTNVNYPKCSKSIGVAPKKTKNIPLPVISDEDVIDDEIIEDDDAYAHASEEVYDGDDAMDDIEEEQSDSEEGESEESEFGGDFEEDAGQEFFDED